MIFGYLTISISDFHCCIWNDTFLILGAKLQFHLERQNYQRFSPTSNSNLFWKFPTCTEISLSRSKWVVHIWTNKLTGRFCETRILSFVLRPHKRINYVKAHVIPSWNECEGSGSNYGEKFVKPFFILEVKGNFSNYKVQKTYYHCNRLLIQIMLLHLNL